ncbi:hypothetical protein OSB04_un000844 [Centaurea solstitialis]|uniref:Uncharacterized protein n=1 Tax=Centaurea solstitialis TaxID=347529 RepID=A0AA38S546_9ASTR|nr:hypothetical protein OSB04_un000844 [Centaurea solstitialis]
MNEDQDYYCCTRLLLLLKITIAGSEINTAGVKLTLLLFLPLLSEEDKERIAMTKQFCDGTTDPNKGPICGRPLALSFQPTTSLLYITDAYLGLLVVGPKGGLATQLAGGFKLLTGIDLMVHPNGIIYYHSHLLWLNTSNQTPPKFYLVMVNKNTTQSGFKFDSTRKFLRYNPLTRQVSVLMSGLSGGGGPAVSR